MCIYTKQKGPIQYIHERSHHVYTSSTLYQYYTKIVLAFPMLAKSREEVLVFLSAPRQYRRAVTRTRPSWWRFTPRMGDAVVVCTHHYCLFFSCAYDSLGSVLLQQCCCCCTDDPTVRSYIGRYYPSCWVFTWEATSSTQFASRHRQVNILLWKIKPLLYRIHT